jgi:hypothetical protein
MYVSLIILEKKLRYLSSKNNVLVNLSTIKKVFELLKNLFMFMLSLLQHSIFD